MIAAVGLRVVVARPFCEALGTPLAFLTKAALRSPDCIVGSSAETTWAEVAAAAAPPPTLKRFEVAEVTIARSEASSIADWEWFAAVLLGDIKPPAPPPTISIARPLLPTPMGIASGPRGFPSWLLSLVVPVGFSEVEAPEGPRTVPMPPTRETEAEVLFAAVVAAPLECGVVDC